MDRTTPEGNLEKWGRGRRGRDAREDRLMTSTNDPWSTVFDAERSLLRQISAGAT
ncbi:MAG: hypothetical protein HYV07_19505 [Deltaproteobacteria bacterium]|nr:hypothetical protein [Deltaproteobacteria bacterium]